NLRHNYAFSLLRSIFVIVTALLQPSRECYVMNSVMQQTRGGRVWASRVRMGGANEESTRFGWGCVAACGTGPRGRLGCEGAQGGASFAAGLQLDRLLHRHQRGRCLAVGGHSDRRLDIGGL